MTQIWTEASIKAELDGHFYEMRHDGAAKVVDRLSGEEIVQPVHRPWTDEDLRRLWEMKRQGLTLDQIEVDLGRDRRAVTQVWGRRRQWKDKVLPPEPGTVLLSDIRRIVCAAYHLGMGDFESHDRAHRAAEVRHVYFWIARYFTGKTYRQISALAGNRDHATVVNGIRRVNENFDRYRAMIELCLFDLGLDLHQRQGQAA